MRDAYVIEAAYRSTWAMLPEKLSLVVAVLEAHAAGIERVGFRGAVEESESRVAARDGATVPRAVGVVRLHGTMIPRGNSLAESSGASSLDRAVTELRSFDANPSVGAIVLDIDSPGGMVHGVSEMHTAIMAADKPVVAQVWNTAASAAYWIASAADEIVVTESGEVGSIGVLAIHFDRSKQLADAGVKPTVVSAGKYKGEFMSFGALSDEAVAYAQSRVDEDYGRFIAAVATGRNVSQKRVRDDFGEGRMVSSARALELGMVDRIGTFEETVSRLSRKMQSKRRASDDTRRAMARRLAVEIR